MQIMRHELDENPVFIDTSMIVLIGCKSVLDKQPAEKERKTIQQDVLQKIDDSLKSFMEYQQQADRLFLEAERERERKEEEREEKRWKEDQELFLKLAKSAEGEENWSTFNKSTVSTVRGVSRDFHLVPKLRRDIHRLHPLNLGKARKHEKSRNFRFNVLSSDGQVNKSLEQNFNNA
ncbi:hypothetical protein P5673_033691, partial [Acropora cervicornis]